MSFIFSSDLGRHLWTWTSAGAAPSTPSTRSKAKPASGANDAVTFESVRALFRRSENPNTTDEILRSQLLAENGFDQSKIKPKKQRKDAADALDAAVSYYSHLQCSDGHWAGDYGGPMFLIPGMLIALHITGHELSKPEQFAIRAYLENQQHDDGGWGLHIENHSTMFGTVLNYISLRLLGAGAEDPTATRARKWIKANGGAEGVPQWGKLWLCVLGVYKYEGMNPVCPDLWMLPTWFPVFHPGRMWCHSRMVYLPMGYIYGHRISAPDSDIVRALRKEVLVGDFDTMDWAPVRNTICPLDIYHPHTKLLDVLHVGLNLWEKIVPGWIRRKALDEAWFQIQREDTWTDYLSIGPVNKMLNMVVHWHQGHKAGVNLHYQRLSDFLWVAEDGMKMGGQVGAQNWETSFSIAAICDSGLAAQYPQVMEKCAYFIDKMQMREDMPNRERYYRTRTKGAWPFTTGNHGWSISDCAAEGLTSAVLLADLHRKKLIKKSEHILPVSRMVDCVELLLGDQNPNGAWSSYEPQRGGDWYEWINPSEVFGKIMVDYPYVECTSSVLLAFHHVLDYVAQANESLPDGLQARMEKAMVAGAKYIVSAQRSDGSFYGSWAVCFTYAAWFAMRTLNMMRKRKLYDNPRSRQQAAEFLLQMQQKDGGWGEDFASCERKVYVQSETSQVVNTAWAVIALIEASNGSEYDAAIERGIKFLMDRQLEDGNFPQEGISGVFNGSCAITYANYRNIFPIWALGVYNQRKTGASTH